MPRTDGGAWIVSNAFGDLRHFAPDMARGHVQGFGQEPDRIVSPNLPAFREALRAYGF